MKELTLILAFVFATCAFELPSSASEPTQFLNARTPVQPWGAARWRNPHVAPKPETIENIYDGSVYDHLEEPEVLETANTEPPWELMGNSFAPESAAPGEGKTGVVWGTDEEGRPILMWYCGYDALGDKPDPIISAIGDKLGKLGAKFYSIIDPRIEERRRAQAEMNQYPRMADEAAGQVLESFLTNLHEVFKTKAFYVNKQQALQHYAWVRTTIDIYNGLDESTRRAPVVYIDNRYTEKIVSEVIPQLSLPAALDFFPDSQGYRFWELQGLGKRDAVSQITSIEHQPNSDSTENLSADYQHYFQAFSAAQSNVSAVILPIVQEMVSRSNSSLVWNAAWSLFSDLTASSPQIVGPFSFGLNCIQWLEDSLFNTLNSTTSLNTTAAHQVQNLTRSLVLATTQDVLDIYNEGWANATTALNRTGLLDIMAKLTSNLSPANSSKIPPAFRNITTPSYDDSFFLSYTSLGSRNSTS